ALLARRLRVHAEELRLHVRVARTLVAMRVVPAVDMAEIRVAKCREERVEDLPDQPGDEAVARERAVPGLVRQKPRLHGGERAAGARKEPTLERGMREQRCVQRRTSS